MKLIQAPKAGKGAIPCAYCARPYGHYTRDHVFPGAWYPDTTPPEVNRWTVPCCRGCNNDKSKLENYSFQRLAACVDADRPAASGIWERAFRGLREAGARDERDRAHRKGAKEAFMAELRVAGGVNPDTVAYFSRVNMPGELAIKINWKKVRKLMELFARGCHAYLEREPLPADADVECHFPHSYEDLAPLIPMLQRMVLHDLGPGILIRRGHARDADDQESLYAFQFWGRAHFFVSVSVGGRRE